MATSDSDSIELLPEHVFVRAAGSEWPTGYEKGHLLGSGGYAEVFRAIRLADGVPVAIKVSNGSEDALRRFRREITEQGKLKNPHVMRILDAGETWYAMPLADGHLTDFAPEVGDDELVRLVDQIAAGLAAAHAADVVHRDVTPNNVLRIGSWERGDLTYVVGDFGLVKRPPGQTSAPATGGRLGTSGFIAPEILVYDAHRADRRSDVYGLGRTIGYALTGAWPDEKSEFAVPFPWALLVDKMTRRAVDERFQSMDDVRSALVDVRRRLAESRRARWRERVGNAGLPDDELKVIGAILAEGDGPFWEPEVRKRMKGLLAPLQITIALMGLRRRAFIEGTHTGGGDECEVLSVRGRDWVLTNRELFKSDAAPVPSSEPDDPAKSDDIPF
jgi:serine/threonine protein kinase